jgi:hypothetical protein
MAAKAAKVKVTHGGAWASQPSVLVDADKLKQLSMHPQMVVDLEKAEILRVTVLPTVKQVRVQFVDVRFAVLALDGDDFPTDGAVALSALRTAILAKYAKGTLKAVCVPPAM